MTGGTDVSMLWEAIDASSALTARFGFTDVDDAVSWLEHLVQEAWTGRVERCDRLVMSAGNLLAWLTVEGRDVIAKCCIDPTRCAHLAEVDALVGWLGANDVPVAAPIAAAGGRLRVERGRFSIGLYPIVEGELLDVRDADQVEAAGRMLAALHKTLSTYPGPLADGPALPGEQLVHGDFRSANILVDGAHISAVLDFDDVGRRSRMRDLGKAAVLLATRYHEWGPTAPETRDTFVAAYSGISPLSSAEQVELQQVMNAVQTHFGWT